jgi:hypothetical protein
MSQNDYYSVTDSRELVGSKPQNMHAEKMMQRRAKTQCSLRRWNK